MYDSRASIIATPKLVLMMLIIISPYDRVDSARARDRRVIPFIQDCDPNISDNSDPKKCLKGDWIDSNIADCERKSTFTTCTPQFSRSGFWVVEEPEPLDGCSAKSNKPINCATHEDSRCVCSSDPSALVNACKCQYWPRNAVTAGSVCYGYHQRVDQWACCYNIQDMNCNTRTWNYIFTQSQSRCTEQNSTSVQQKFIFNCGDCNCLQACKSRCDDVIRNRFHTAAGRDGCGAWLDCFRGCCVQAYKDQSRSRSTKKRQSETDPSRFCGDGECLEPESRTTCPSDCCSTVNSNCTLIMRDTCLPACCRTSSCCLSTGGGGTSPAVRNTYAPGILPLALMFATVEIAILDTCSRML